jgi:hypothetical protein
VSSFRLTNDNAFVPQGINAYERLLDAADEEELSTLTSVCQQVINFHMVGRLGEGGGYEGSCESVPPTSTLLPPMFTET